MRAPKKMRVAASRYLSSQNPFEVFAVIYLVITGINWILGVQPGVSGIEQALNPLWPYFWNGSMLFFGLGTLFSYFCPDYFTGKLLKMWCMLGMTGANIAFGVCLIVAYGSRTLGGVFLILLGLASAARAAQCFQEILDRRPRLVTLRAEAKNDS